MVALLAVKWEEKPEGQNSRVSIGDREALRQRE